jgi:hypothetical protein
MDEIRDVDPLQEEHRVDVGGADPCAEVKMRLRDLRMPVAAACHDVSPGHGLSLLYLYVRQP